MADQQQAPTKQPDRQHTLDEEIDELKNEIGFRYGVYAKAVAAGKMSQMDADYKISVMKSALNRLKSFRYMITNIYNPF